MSFVLVLVLSLSFVDSTFNPQTWMGDLPNREATRISAINIPGTHESMAVNNGDYTICQAYSITEQLAMGYRWFDIRLKYIQQFQTGWIHGKMEIWHGPAWQHKQVGVPYTFQDLHDSLKTFLTGVGNKECVLLKVKDEAFAKGSQTKFARKMKKIVLKDETLYYFPNKTHQIFPYLSECEGKVIILGDGEWAKKEEWKSLSPIDWIDVNYGTKADSTAYNEEKRKKRLNIWKRSVDKTMQEGRVKVVDGKSFYRNGINANSFKKGMNGGTPLNWAKYMNPKVVEYLKTKSFTGTTCNNSFFGAINVDLPEKNENTMKAKEIARVVIESNCQPQGTNTNVAHLNEDDEWYQYLEDDEYDDDEYDDDEYDDEYNLLNKLYEYLFGDA